MYKSGDAITYDYSMRGSFTIGWFINLRSHGLNFGLCQQLITVLKSLRISSIFLARISSMLCLRLVYCYPIYRVCNIASSICTSQHRSKRQRLCSEIQSKTSWKNKKKNAQSNDKFIPPTWMHCDGARAQSKTITKIWTVKTRTKKCLRQRFDKHANRAILVNFKYTINSPNTPRSNTDPANQTLRKHEFWKQPIYRTCSRLQEILIYK